METLLAILRAAGEETRLRLLSLCSHTDLTVSDLTRILGQSQPRISRHLKVLCDCGLLLRLREGSWVFYRLQTQGVAAEAARQILHLLPTEDPMVQRDRGRLELVQSEREAAAAAYFANSAAQWDAVRSLHADEHEVESCLWELLHLPAAPHDDRPLGDLVDVGTGTGRMMTLLGPVARSGVGIDQSREMLAVARLALDRDDLRHCMVRQGDMYAVPLEDACADTVVIYQVLHYAETPAAVIAEAARLLRPRGRLALVDLAPHDVESLREQHNHRRLGFAGDDVAAWCHKAGLALCAERSLPGQPPAHPVTVTLWLAEKIR